MNVRPGNLLAAAAACMAAAYAAAQPPAAAPPSDRDELLARIAALRVEQGLTAIDLAQVFRELALLYQESEDHSLAVAALEEARHITRVNRGFSSPEEAVLLQQQIRSEKALGNDQRVWDIEQGLLTIARQHYDDSRMAPIFRELAEDRAEALADYQGGGMPPEVFLGCYYVGDWRPYHDKRSEVRPPVKWADTPNAPGCRSGSSSSVRRRLRGEILAYYADAIEVIVKSGNLASQELRDLERAAFLAGRRGPFPASPPIACLPGGRWVDAAIFDLLLQQQLIGTCLEPVIHSNGTPVGSNTGGSVSLIRLIVYEMRSGAPEGVRAAAIADLADWYLAGTPPGRRRYDDSSGPALALYERAYGEIERDDAARAALFTPDVPIMLPAYEPSPLGPVATAKPARYIDAAFAVTKHGIAQNVEIRASEGATRAEERDLRRLLDAATFRPLFANGKVADSAPVVVRYTLDR